jgi:chitodextrinase
MEYILNYAIKLFFITVGFWFISNVQAAPLWDKSTVYTNGDHVEYSDAIYQARWWTRGNLPGIDPEWKFIECTDAAVTPPCDGGAKDPDPTDPDPAAAIWRIGNVYLGGDKVIYAAAIFQAKWWTQGDEPSKKNQSGPWVFVKECLLLSGTCDPSGDPTDFRGPIAKPSGGDAMLKSEVLMVNYLTSLPSVFYDY